MIGDDICYACGGGDPWCRSCSGASSFKRTREDRANNALAALQREREDNTRLLAALKHADDIIERLSRAPAESRRAMGARQERMEIEKYLDEEWGDCNCGAVKEIRTWLSNRGK